MGCLEIVDCRANMEVILKHGYREKPISTQIGTQPKNTEKRVLFVIWGLRPGGAERVFVNVVNNINDEIRPIVVVLGKEEGFSDELKPDLQVHYLCKKGKWDIFRLIMKLSSIMRKERPAGIVSFGYYSNQLAILTRALSGLKTPVCISERIETTTSIKNMNFQMIRKIFLKATYRMADKVIAVSNGTKDSLIKHFGIQGDKVTVIYNPVDLEKIRTLASQEITHPCFNEKNTQIIMAVGRLTEQKGFSCLIRSFSIVLKEVGKARLIILGEGTERPKLESLVLESGLKDEVAFLGYQKNPYKFMARSDLFVLSSLYEGFPNVVIEAMACGTPVISTRCSSGPDEIITDGVNGLLVPVRSEEALAEAMIKLLREPGLRDMFSKAGKERAKDFSLHKIVLEYEKLLSSIS